MSSRTYDGEPLAKTYDGEPLAKTSYVEPLAKTSYVEPLAKTSYVEPLAKETRALNNQIQDLKKSLPPIIYNDIKGIFIKDLDENENEKDLYVPSDSEIQQHIQQSRIKLRIKQLENELRELNQTLTLLSSGLSRF
uniref:Uncharacterized protein n=1 Tax=viral metagenome TaxID=1070528 RepID=A0A6C0ASC3_9ZZZZ